MATIINTLASHSDAVQSSYVTASISPSANRLILLLVAVSRSGVGNDMSVSGAGMTWTEVTTVVNGNVRLSLFRAVSASPGSGALTIDFGGQTQSNVYWSVNEVIGAVISGTNGSDAIVQSASASHASGTGNTTGMGVSLAAFAKQDNLAFGGLNFNAAQTITVGSGFTQLSQEGTFHKLVAEYAQNKTTVDWSWTSIDVFECALAVEIKTRAQGGAFLFNMLG